MTSTTLVSQGFGLIALSSADTAESLAFHLQRLDCDSICVNGLEEVTRSISKRKPAFLILEMEFSGNCSLEFCQNDSRLLNEIPVAFYVKDQAISFSKAMSAMKSGAVDVLHPPFDIEKLGRLAALTTGGKSANLNNEESFSNRLLKERSLVESEETKVISALKAKINSSSVNSVSANGSLKSNSSVPKVQLISDHLIGNRVVVDSPVSPVVPMEERLRQLEQYLFGKSQAMQRIRKTIADIADTTANIMIFGESGTGKELVATAVHKLSRRCNGPFKPVNMTEIPQELAESLLFGHERGSFTGAERTQMGVCEAADGGTIFLDEIGEMSPVVQPKLLRFLQEGSIKRVGSNEHKKVDVRVITATNRDPKTIVQSGVLREDLFFRLHVVPINLPPLRERREDIEQLALLFLNRYAKEYHRIVIGFTPQAMEILTSFDWPGNVRQLQNVIERLVVFAKDEYIEAEAIPAEVQAISTFGQIDSSNGHADGHMPTANRFENSNGNGFEHSNAFPHSNQNPNTTAYQGDSYNPAPLNGATTLAKNPEEIRAAITALSPIQRNERSAIIEALQRVDGHVVDAANLLQIGQATVYRKIKLYHIPHKRKRRRTPK